MEVDTFMLIEEGVHVHDDNNYTGTNDDKLFVDVDGTLTKRMQHCVFVKRKLLLIISISFSFSTLLM